MRAWDSTGLPGCVTHRGMRPLSSTCISCCCAANASTRPHLVHCHLPLTQPVHKLISHLQDMAAANMHVMLPHTHSNSMKAHTIIHCSVEQKCTKQHQSTCTGFCGQLYCTGPAPNCQHKPFRQLLRAPLALARSPPGTQRTAALCCLQTAAHPRAPAAA